MVTPLAFRRTRVVVACAIWTVLCIVGTGELPCFAQSEQAQETQADDSQDASKDDKERARQERIDEYLEWKAERKADKDARRADKEAAKEAKAAEQAAAAAAAGTTVAAAGDTEEVDSGGRSARSSRSRSGSGTTTTTSSSSRGGALVATGAVAAATAGAVAASEKQAEPVNEATRTERRIAERLSTTPIAGDPEVRHLIDLLGAGAATTAQKGALAGTLAENGYVEDSLELYRDALKEEPDNAVLLFNFGTVLLKHEQFSEAETAFTKVLKIEPNNAMAHYSLGSVRLEKGNYNGAIDSYRTALILDPDLGDPSVNPQCVNNSVLTNVKLMIYQTQEGSLSLPLVDVEEGETGD